MDPKMTIKYAADFLGVDQKNIRNKISQSSIKLNNSSNQNYFGHQEAKKIFNIKIPPKIVAFQIVKGGTGKTSLASAFATRASLLGLNVLCIDLDLYCSITRMP